MSNSTSSSSKTDVDTVGRTTTMPIIGNSNNTHNCNSSNSTTTNNNNSSSGNGGSGSGSHGVEQPQTKRQKIEKIKTNANKTAKVAKCGPSRAGSTMATASPPPDIIDTGGVDLLETNFNGKVNNQQPIQPRCSSLSSSANSISTPSSTNNSPTSTPAGSRVSSLSHLLNEQVVVAAPADAVNTHTYVTTDQNQIQHNDLEGDGHGNGNVNSGCGVASTESATTSSCADEVDRIEIMPDLLTNTTTTTTMNGTNAKLLPTQSVAQQQRDALAAAHAQDMREFEASLNKQCLCGVSERTLRKPFQSHYSLDVNGHKRIANLSEWPTEKLLQFLSNLQLLFDIYLKQNSKGFICARIMDVCDVLIRNDHNLIDEIIVLAGYNNDYVQFLAARVLASFLVIAKQELNDDWLKSLVENLFNFERLDGIGVQKIHFSLEIIKRIVEWKDIDLHPLEDEIVDIHAGGGGGGGGAVTEHARSAAEMSNTTTSESEVNDALAGIERYFHFQPQQPTLETNYFALQYRGNAPNGGVINNVENEDEDVVDEEEDEEEYDDLDDDVLGENMVHAHARRQHHHHNHMNRQTPHQQEQHHLHQHHTHPSPSPHSHAHPHTHFTSYDLHGTAMSSNPNYLPPTIAYETSAAPPPPPPPPLPPIVAPSISHAAPYTNDHAHHQQYIHHQNPMHEQHTHASPSFSAHFPNNANTAEQSPSSSAAAPFETRILPSGCHIITLTDSESFDTSHLKGVTIKILESKWPALVRNMSTLILHHMHIDHAEHCILNFLQLWENIISVKANLSVVETRPFYAQLDKFELLLQQQQLTCTVYKQLLCLFNEALCYGSTLALQDMLPVETCRLAQRIVRHVKEARILDSLPRRQPENVVGFLGFKRTAVSCTDDDTTTQFRCPPPPASAAEQSTAYQRHAQQQPQQQQSIYEHIPPHSALDGSGQIEMDKTILQKMVLLVLKSVAVTVKEIRSDSSDSSIDSQDCDAYQDMVLIERSIRDVLRKLESFIKHKLEFHPEWHFSKILVHLFADQDDHLIEAMVCTLDVTAGISFRNNAFPELVAMLNPVYMFLEFLELIENSYDLLLDLLVSNETCFLLYLLRFLKYIRANWDMFLRSCRDFGMGAPKLDEAMGVLIRLRLNISRLVARQLYPYDISPVLRLLESCEGLYEGNDRSLT